MALGQYLVAGLATASIYSLISLGLTMTYGVARVLNVANAMMFGLSAFATYELVERGVPYVGACALAIVLVSCVGMVTYFLFFIRQLERPFNALVISLSLVVVIQSLIIAIWGLDVYRIPSGLRESFLLGDTAVVKGAVATIVATIVVTAVLFVVLHHTAMGRSMRAVQEDPATAVLLGINAGRVIASTFAIGTALSALAGVLAGTFVPFTGESASSYGVKTFAIVIVGGLGRPVGAVAASVLLATAETVPTALGLATWSPSFLYAALVLILVFRPQGLFGTFGHDHGGGLEAPGGAQRSGHRASRRRQVGAIAVVATLVTIAFVALSPYFLTNAANRSTAAFAAVLVLLAYSVWIPMKFVGVPSFGHVAIWGAACYVVAIGQEHYEWGLLMRFVVAVVVAVVLSLLMALITMRVNGVVAEAAVTLGIAGLLVNLLSNLKATGGSLGKIFTEPIALFGAVYGPRDSDIIVYSLAAVLTAVAVVLVAVMQRSRWGVTLIAVRDSPLLARSLGTHTYWHRVGGFTISGVLVGLASVLYLHQNRYLDPSLFRDTMSINIVLAVIIGGAAYLGGPVMGAVLLAFLPELLPFDGVVNRAVYGIVVVLIATFWSDGLVGKAHALLDLATSRTRRPSRRPEPALLTDPDGAQR